jgi:hypothetical protein
MMLGYNMAGNEKAFFDAIDLSMDYNTFTYFEVGVARGETIHAVYTHLMGKEKFLIGIDLPGCKASELFKGNSDILIHTCGADVFFNNCTHKANFIFIDACHGYECVTRNFNDAEKHIKDGGIICFHDSDEDCQGTHWPQHCGGGINVREALIDLGLLDKSRPGWRLINETTGDKDRGGHGCVFVQKV